MNEPDVGNQRCGFRPIFDPTQFVYSSHKTNPVSAYADLIPGWSSQGDGTLLRRFFPGNEAKAVRPAPRKEDDFDHQAYQDKKVWNEAVTIADRFAMSGVVATLEAEGMRRQRMDAEGVNRLAFYNSEATWDLLRQIDRENDRFGEIVWQVLRQADLALMGLVGSFVTQATDTEVTYPDFFQDRDLRDQYNKSGDKLFGWANALDIGMGYLFSKLHKATGGILNEIQQAARQYYSPSRQERLAADIAALNDKEGRAYYQGFLKLWITYGPGLRLRKLATAAWSVIRLSWVLTSLESLCELAKVPKRVRDRFADPAAYLRPDEFAYWEVLPIIMAASDRPTDYLKTRLEQLRLAGLILFADGNGEEQLAKGQSQKAYWSFVKSASKTSGPLAYHMVGPGLALPLLGLVHFATLKRMCAAWRAYPPKILRIVNKPKYGAVFRSYLNSLFIYTGQGIQATYTMCVGTALMWAYLFSGIETLPEAYDELLQAGKAMPAALELSVMVLMGAPQLICTSKDFRNLVHSLKTLVSKMRAADHGGPYTEPWTRFVHLFGALEPSTEDNLGDIARPINDAIGLTSSAFALVAARYMADLQLIPLGYFLNAVSSVLDIVQTTHKKMVQNATIRAAAAGLFNRLFGWVV